MMRIAAAALFFFLLVPVFMQLSAQGWLSKGERIPFQLSVPDSALSPGILAIKISAVDSAFISFRQVGGKWKTGNAGLDAAFSKLGVYRVDTLFAQAINNAWYNENGSAVLQMQQWGFFRWFCIRFSNTVSVKSAWQMMSSMPPLEVAEPVGKIVQQAVPNDPNFSQQWHLQNTGQFGGLAGADIKALPAWDIETGSSDVLVAVHDGGIQIDHPDLQQNIWSGIGYNFVTNSPILTADKHATHVAGILGAVSNNNLGVSGIAGGNGSTTSGCRLMSLQIVGGTPVQAAYEANAYLFAANNGAAISQNSWSYNAPDFFPSYTADAIDYFIANGGGTVLKGGLVVFAAGNYNNENFYYPAPYSRVVAVAASNQFDVKASYSSFGTWADITAPGGDASAPILSTISGSSYGSLYGTSMACPQVSGAAALLASHLKGRALADDIRSLLQYGADNIYPLNSGFTGKLGAGRLNIFKALQRADSIVRLPVLNPVTSAAIALQCSQVKLSWNNASANSQVLVAMAAQDAFIGNPFGKYYAVGDTISTGGVVVYKGNGGELNLPMPVDGSKWQFRIWVTDATGSNYSVGVNLYFTVPGTVTSTAFTPASTSIILNWQRQCPNRGVLLAWSADGLFGTPTGDPASVTTIAGGGQALQFGNQTTFTHNGLHSDQGYFYAWYPYLYNGISWEYGKPMVTNASTLCGIASLPVEESFTSINFPPEQWRIIDGGPNGSAIPDHSTWQRSTLAGSRSGDNACALINAYTQNGGESKEVLRTSAFVLPSIADSLVVSFDYSYRAYAADADVADSLELAWTADCGNTYTSIWKKGGVALATVDGLSTAEFVPSGPDQWKQWRQNLLPLLPANSPASFMFRATNKFGQNIWLDNISVKLFTPPINDAAIVKWASPTDSFYCSNSVLPVITIANRGTDTLRSVWLKWLVNGTISDSLQLQGLRVAYQKDTTVPLKAIVFPSGISSIEFRCSWPNGKTDEATKNDTLRKFIAITSTAALPLHESFETSTNLPAGWLSIPAANKDWKIASVPSFDGSHSAMLNRFDDTVPSSSIELVTPVLKPNAGADSLHLSFAVANSMKTVNGAVYSDTLEIYATTNCGQTKQLVYRRAGLVLATTGSSTNISFVPRSSGDWRVDTVDLTPLKTQLSGGFQLVFQLVKGNGNNLFLDDIHILSKTIPPALKEKGYGVYPNPFAGYFSIWHLQPPAELRSARLVNATGQLLQQWQWTSGTAPQIIPVNGTMLAKGMYWIQLKYEGYSRTIQLLKE